MIRVQTIEFSVPRWEVVKHHADHDRRWPGEPPPDLAEASQEALSAGRILVGAHANGEADRLHPYVISGAVHPYYGYADEPVNRNEPGIGKVAHAYGFHPHKPDDLSVLYDYDREGMDFEIVVGRDDQVSLLMEVGDMTHKLGVGEPGDDMMNSLVRAAVVVHVLDAVEGISRFDILPYDQDTLRIAHARLAHVLKWQFEKSRIKPLFA